MSFLRFSDSGKDYLLHEMDDWAKSIAAHMLAKLTAITSDHHVLARAMDEFPAVLREQMAEVLDDIDINIQANVVLEEFECGREDRGQVQFSVTLDGLAAPDKKIGVVKAVREITLLGIKDAKDLVEAAPKLVKENVGKDEADELKKKLEAAGGRVSIK